MKTVAIVGTLDTKGAEFAFLKRKSSGVVAAPWCSTRAYGSAGVRPRTSAPSRFAPRDRRLACRLRAATAARRSTSWPERSR